MRQLSTIRFLVLALCLPFLFCTPALAETPRAEQGVLDLRTWDFYHDGTLELNGQWEFHWQEFQTTKSKPDHFEEPVYWELPGTWLGQDYRGKTLGSDGYATYRLTVLLPEDPVDLGVRAKRVQSAFRLLINGEALMEAGRIGRSYAEEEPRRTRHLAISKQARDQLEITVQLSNFNSFSGGGFLSPLTLGTAEHQAHQHMMEYTKDYILAGAFICLGIFIMFLHFGRRKETSYMVLYLLSFMAGIHLLTVNTTLLELFPGVSWFWTERVAYISTVLIVALIYEFLHHLYPGQTSKWASVVSRTVAGAMTAYAILWQRPVPTEFSLALYALCLIVILACVHGLRAAFIQKEPGIFPVVTGVAILILTGINDLLMLEGTINSIYLMPFGILCMLLLFASTLATKVNSTFAQNDRLAAAIKSSDECVIIYDANDQLVFWNDASLKFVGEDLQGLFKSGMTYKDLVRALANSGDFPGQEEAYIKGRMKQHQHPGPTYEVQRNGRWHLYREDTIPDGGSITFITDISVQKDKEDKLQSALMAVEEANQAKVDFLSNMSHELRTPLNAILGFSEIIKTSAPDTSRKKLWEYSELIHVAGHQLLGLVNDILDLTRIEAGKIDISQEEIDLIATIDTCLALVREKAVSAEIKLSSAISGDLQSLHADPLRLRQIILILLDNAIKFTDAGGKIDINVRPNDVGGISIDVSDTGIGIVQADLGKVLEKFGQAQNGHAKLNAGLGLGLSIAKELMNLHGGTLEIQSEPGIGTTVSASFPPEEVVAMRSYS